MRTEKQIKAWLINHKIGISTANYISGFIMGKLGISWICIDAYEDGFSEVDYADFISWFESPSEDENDPTSDDYIDWKAKTLSAEDNAREEIKRVAAHASETYDRIFGKPKEEIVCEFEVDVPDGYLVSVGEHFIVDDNISLRKWCVEQSKMDQTHIAGRYIGTSLSFAEEIYQYIKTGKIQNPFTYDVCSCKKGGSCEK